MEVETDVRDGGQRPIVVGYDGSQGARAALAYAAELFPGRRALIVTAWLGVAESTPEFLFAPGGVVVAAAEALGDVMRERAQELAAEGARLGRESGLEAEPHTVHGEHAIWRGIVDSAVEHDAEVVIVGSRGRAPVVAALLGSVATGVVNHASRPVLVVPVSD